MAQRLIAGNWKMNGLRDALAEARAIINGLAPLPDTFDTLICPPFTLIAGLASVAKDSRLTIGGQDCHFDAHGAHTGDVSAEMLADCGASHVIVGHSERRADHGETNALVAAKATAAFRAGVTPIICVGETSEERASGQAVQSVANQIATSVPQDAAGRRVVIAYEPIWAIGSGRTPTLDEIAEMHDSIRLKLSERTGDATARETPLLYGGSMAPANAAEILSVPNVDGGLIGGASLKADSFLSICAAAA